MRLHKAIMSNTVIKVAKVDKPTADCDYYIGSQGAGISLKRLANLLIDSKVPTESKKDTLLDFIGFEKDSKGRVRVSRLPKPVRERLKGETNPSLFLKGIKGNKELIEASLIPCIVEYFADNYYSNKEVNPARGLANELATVGIKNWIGSVANETDSDRTFTSEGVKETITQNPEVLRELRAEQDKNFTLIKEAQAVIARVVAAQEATDQRLKEAMKLPKSLTKLKYTGILSTLNRYEKISHSTKKELPKLSHSRVVGTSPIRKLPQKASTYTAKEFLVFMGIPEELLAKDKFIEQADEGDDSGTTVIEKVPDPNNTGNRILLRFFRRFSPALSNAYEFLKGEKPESVYRYDSETGKNNIKTLAYGYQASDQAFMEEYYYRCLHNLPDEFKESYVLELLKLNLSPKLLPEEFVVTCENFLNLKVTQEVLPTLNVELLLDFESKVRVSYCEHQYQKLKQLEVKKGTLSKKEKRAIKFPQENQMKTFRFPYSFLSAIFETYFADSAVRYN